MAANDQGHGNASETGPSEGSACSFTYNREMMAILIGMSGRHLSEDADFRATRNRLLAIHSQPFDARNFYTPSQLFCEFPFGFLTSLDEWEKPSPLATGADRQMHDILQSTFVRVATGTGGVPLPEEYAPIIQNLKSEMEDWRIIADDEVTLDEQIDGHSGIDGEVVHRGRWDDEVVAVKSSCPSASSIYSEILPRFIMEAAIHASLAHPNVVQLYGVTPSSKFIMELATGTLRKMCHGRTLEWRIKQLLLQQASAGLTHLHSLEKPIVHGSVSSLNFVTFGMDPGSCTVKLAGLKFAATDQYGKSRFCLPCGESVWDCPEPLVTVKSDVFGFGVVAYEVVSGLVPYSGGSTYSLHGKKTGKLEEPCPVRPMDCPTELHKVLKRCCSPNPSERPTMEEVDKCIMGLPEDWSKEVNFGAVRRRVRQNLRQADGHVASCVTYNHNLMKFLWQQLQKAETMIHHMPEEPAAAREAQEWRVSCFELDDAVRLGCSLIRRHSMEFDFQAFYTVQEAWEGVEQVCKKLRDIAMRWDLGTEIGITVASASLVEDERFLQSCLAYLFEQGTSSQLPMQADANDWLQVKAHLARQLSSLRMVNEGDIDICEALEGGGSVVHRARWNEREVAVKRLRRRASPDLNLQEFAKLYAEACVQASLSHPHIAPLLAVSKSGLLVMELACCDLQTLCGEVPLDWTAKCRFLIQVGEALDYLHSQERPVAHCDVKSPNVLIFGDKGDLGVCTAQLSDFGISVKDTTTASVIVRRPGGTPHWMAPETYDEVDPSPVGDVFSFGVLMYEVVSQMPPYGGRGTPCASILRMKLEGQPACRLPDDCPSWLRRLMERCCSVSPGSRPTMGEVLEIMRAGST